MAALLFTLLLRGLVASTLLLLLLLLALIGHLSRKRKAKYKLKMALFLAARVLSWFEAFSFARLYIHTSCAHTLPHTIIQEPVSGRTRSTIVQIPTTHGMATKLLTINNSCAQERGETHESPNLAS